jgi:tetratricopeptide (TPR) repeat protein
VLRSGFALYKFVALMLVAIAECLGSAASLAAHLSGVVYSEATNQRIAHASVALRDEGGNFVQDSVATDSGEFAFLGLHAGSFILKITALGYQPLDMPVQVDFASERGISVFLKTSKNSSAGAAVNPSISAHELSMPKSARDRGDTGKKRLYGDKNPQSALQNFDAAVAKAPDYYEAFYLIGIANLSLRNPAQAEKNLQKSVDLSNHTYGDAVLALALLWIACHDIARGEPMLRQGLELNPNHWLDFYELGKLEMYRGHLELALHAAEKGQSLAPSQPILYRLLSLIHLKQKNYSAALVDLDAYIKLDPNSPDGLHAKEVRADTQKRLANSEPAPSASPPAP